jgi:hypothetical protein
MNLEDYLSMLQKMAARERKRNESDKASSDDGHVGTGRF